MSETVKSRLDRLEQEAERQRDVLEGSPPMHEILQGIHRSAGGTEFCELARQKAIRGLTEEEEQRGIDLFCRAMVDEFGPEFF